MPLVGEYRKVPLSGSSEMDGCVSSLSGSHSIKKINE